MELLFSYGTLQQDGVQLSTFGRLLTGKSDSLPGYKVGEVRITDPHVLAVSGKEMHPALIPSGNPMDAVAGMVFEVTPQELTRADEYEVDDYVRVKLEFESGIQAWAYIAAEFAPRL